MPAMMRTSVWPIATTRSGQTLDSRLVMLYGEATLGSIRNMTANSAMQR